MQWLLDNWIWVLLGGGMVAMHLFGHGKHGGHGMKSPKGTSVVPETKLTPPVEDTVEKETRRDL
jgi:hypothetical protein